MQTSSFKQVIFQTVITTAVIFGLGLGASWVLAAWTEPTANPPYDNVDAPVNIGNITQNKTGGLGVGAFTASSVKITDGTQGAGKVLTSNADGLASWQSSAQIPKDAVMYFFLSACPAGWSEFTQGVGRYAVGTDSKLENGSGKVGSTVGEALGHLENRPAGKHTHTYGVGMYNSPGGGNGEGIWWGTGTTGAGNAPGGAALKDDTNAPYIQLLVCKKN